MDEANIIAQAPTYAGFWRRFNAYGIDATFVVLIAWLLDYMFLGNAFAQEQDGMQQLSQMLLAAQGGQISPEMTGQIKDALLNSMFGGSVLGPNEFITIIVSAIYNIWFVIGDWQATPGKHWLRMKVVMVDGSRLTLQQSAFRHAISGISMLPMGLGCITIWFTKERLAPHDMVVGTRVIMRPKT